MDAAPGALSEPRIDYTKRVELKIKRPPLGDMLSNKSQIKRASLKQVMPAGGRDLQRALGAFLALDVAQVERGGGGLVHLRRGP